MPASAPASMSRAFASRTWAVRSSSASAIASRALFLVAVSSRASVREASFAPAQVCATDEVWVANLAKGTEQRSGDCAMATAGELLQHEVVAVHGLLAGAGQ